MRKGRFPIVIISLPVEGISRLINICPKSNSLQPSHKFAPRAMANSLIPSFLRIRIKRGECCHFALKRGWFCNAMDDVFGFSAASVFMLKD